MQFNPLSGAPHAETGKYSLLFCFESGAERKQTTKEIWNHSQRKERNAERNELRTRGGNLAPESADESESMDDRFLMFETDSRLRDCVFRC